MPDRQVFTNNSRNQLRQPFEFWALLRVCSLVGLTAHEFKARQFTLAGFISKTVHMRTLCGHEKRRLEKCPATYGTI